MKTLKNVFIATLILTISVSVSFACKSVTKPKKLDDLFGDSNMVYYDGSKGIGINHIAYWTATDEEIDALFVDDPDQAAVEKTKWAKLTPNGISSMNYPPDDYEPIPGWEVIGTLTGHKGKRTWTQNISLVIPDDWNGKLIVFGTPGTRSEYGEASLMVPWLLERGYATIEGDKGMPNGNNDLLNGQHVSQHWGAMMIDLAEAAKKTIKKATGMKPLYTYAAGMSNGGLQTRLALELDHARVMKGKKRGFKHGKRPWMKRGKKRLFDGGLAWSGSYYPRKELLDTNGDGVVTPVEYAEHADITLFGALNKANMLMGWAYDVKDENGDVIEYSITNAANLNANPPYPTVYDEMLAIGFHPDSARVWGGYNANFDYYKTIPGNSAFAGIGYLNFSSSYYLAEARGETAPDIYAYTALNFGTAEEPIWPPMYQYLRDNADTLGFNQESIDDSFLKTANSAEFSVPLIEIHGTKDSLVPTMGQGVAYREAVEQFGSPDLHRLYLIKDGMHVEYQSDPASQGGHVDFDFDGDWDADDDALALEMTQMQGYAMLAMDKLEDWVEDGVVPVESGTVITDPVGDTVQPIEERNMDPLP